MPRAAMGDAQAFLTRAMRWKKDECLMWPYASNQNQIPMISLRQGRKRTNRSVRNLVCESARGYAPTKWHKAYMLCEKPRCVAPCHMEWRDCRSESAKLMAALFTTEERSERTRSARARQSPERRKEIGRMAAAALTPAGLERIVAASRSTMMKLTPEQRTERARKGGATAAASMTAEQIANRTDLARAAIKAMTPAELSERARRAQAARTPEQRSDAARKMNAAQTPEQKSKSARNRWAKLSPEARAERGRLMRAAKFRTYQT